MDSGMHDDRDPARAPECRAGTADQPCVKIAMTAATEVIIERKPP
jgi:hypothetical protein